MAEQLTNLKARAAERGDVTQTLELFVQKLENSGPPHQRPGVPPSLFALDSAKQLFGDTEGADAAPTAATKAASPIWKCKSIELWTHDVTYWRPTFPL